MKLQSALSAVLFASVAMLSLAAQAADAEKPQAADAEKPPAAAEMKAEQGAKAVEPHSHLQEKTGIVPKAPAAAEPAKKNAWNDRRIHLHPRDGK